MSGAYTTRLTERFLSSVTPPPIHSIVRILLYDFVTGSSELLAAHREGLTRHVVPFLRPDGPPTSVWIGGLASRRGSEAINIPLMPSATSESIRIEPFQSSGTGLGFGASSVVGSFDRIGPR